MQIVQEAEAAFQEDERRRRTDPRFMIPGLPRIPSAHTPSAYSQGKVIPRTYQPYSHQSGTLMSRSFGRMNLDGSGWTPPTMQDYLDDTNRRNRELMRYGQPGINPANFGTAPTSPFPRTPYYRIRP